MEKNNPNKSETDKRLDDVYARMVRAESDPTLLKNLIDRNVLVDDFVDANKREILIRSIN
jgi:hypothetical protein